MVGVICFANDGGLGYQTRRLTQMIRPSKVLIVNSASFSKNKEQHLDWYENFNSQVVHGFPTNRDVRLFLRGLTHVLVCENPLNFTLLTEAKKMGIKVYIQSNYEFCDHLNKILEMPELFLMPSYWHVDTMKERFGRDRVVYLPPPIDPNEFKEARDINFARQGKLRLLHIVGTLAAHDRNGTLDLIQAIKNTKADFELVIKSQHPLPSEHLVDDSRVRYSIENIKDPGDLYKDFDALLLPRRYGGLSLACNEALMSGLPVLMPDISPNNQLLPKEWLFRSNWKGEFLARIPINFYESENISEKIDWLATQDLNAMKLQAFELGYNNFSDVILKEKYERLFS